MNPEIRIPSSAVKPSRDEFVDMQDNIFKPEITARPFTFFIDPVGKQKPAPEADHWKPIFLKRFSKGWDLVEAVSAQLKDSIKDGLLLDGVYQVTVTQQNTLALCYPVTIHGAAVSIGSSTKTKKEPK